MANKEATLTLKVKDEGSKQAIGGIQGMLLNLNNAIGIARTVWSGLKGVVDSILGSWGEQEQAINALNQSLVQQGIYSADLSKKYIDMASALQRVSVYGDEQIVQAQAIIQAQLGQQEITESLMKATLDFASAKKIDLASAAELVSKTIGSETNSLARYGIEVKNGTSETERMSLVIEGLNSKWGGQAQAATQATGSFAQFKNALSDIAERLGGIIGPAIVAVTKYFTELLYKVLEFDTGFKILESGFQGVIGVASLIASAFDAMGTQIGGVIAAIAQAAQGNWKEAWQTIKDSAADGGQKVYDSALSTKDKLTGVWTDQNATADALRKQDEENLIASNQRKQEIAAQNNAITMEAFSTQKQAELEQELALEQMRLDAKANQQQIYTDQQIASAATSQEKLKMMQTNQKAFEAAQEADKRSRMTAMQRFEADINSKKTQDTMATLGTISTLQNAHDKKLAAIGRAAASANIIMSTAQGVAKAFSLGPILGPILAPIVAVAGAAQLAQVNGVQLAEGGIVKASNGGTQATIGEGGRDEAVIPLEKGGGGLGNQITINAYGGMLGTESEAREFALVIDKELMKLRQNKESVAFDSDLT